MFTVIIAEKKHFDAIENNKLFFRPFLDKSPENIAFCEWNPSGQTLYESVPKLISIVGRHKVWRALIVNESNTDNLQNTLYKNPFDLVSIAASKDENEKERYNDYLEKIAQNTIMSFKDYQSEIRDDITLWKEDCIKRNQEKLKLEEEYYKEVLSKNLAKLGTVLCYQHEEFDRKKQAEEFYYNEELNTAYELSEGYKRFEIEYSVIKEESFRKIRKDLLDEFLPEEKGKTQGSLGITLPTEVYCIAERTTETGFFNPAIYWENHDTFEYSNFVSRNGYNEKMRFLLFDILPKTHVDYRIDNLRFLYNLLIFGMNDIPNGTFQPRKLYSIASENEEEVLKEISSVYNLKLKNTVELLQGKIKKIIETAPKTLSDREAEDIFCKKMDIRVDLDANFDYQKLFVEEGYGIAADSPVEEKSRWKGDYLNSIESVGTLVKQPRRQLKKAIINSEGQCVVEENRIRALNDFQLEDVKSYTEHEENKLIEQEVSDIFNIDRFYKNLDKENENIKKEISHRMRKKPMVLSVLLCSVLFLLCFIPMIISNRTSFGSVIVALIFMGVSVALLTIILIISLVVLKKPLVKAMKKYNEVADKILSEVTNSMKQFAEYLTALCNVKRGYRVLNYKEDLNIDIYDDKIRLLTSHLKDINETMYFLRQEYRDFIDDYYVDEEDLLSKPYQYNFEKSKGKNGKFDYPPPYVKENYAQIEFLSAGNIITVPSGFTKRITMKMEEIYE